MEQDTGVEPAFTAWEAVVLPIYESCVGVGIISEGDGKFKPFLSQTVEERGGYFQKINRKTYFIFPFYAL